MTTNSGKTQFLPMALNTSGTVNQFLQHVITPTN